MMEVTSFLRNGEQQFYDFNTRWSMAIVAISRPLQSSSLRMQRSRFLGRCFRLTMTCSRRPEQPFEGGYDGANTTRTTRRRLEAGVLRREARRRLRVLLSDGRRASRHHHVHAGRVHVGTADASRAAE